jgi:hypothetical protein
MLMTTEQVRRTEYAEEQSALRQAAREAPGPKWYIVQCGRRTDQQVLDVFKRFKIETYYPTVTQFRPMPRRRMSHAQRRSGVVVMQPQDAAVFPRYVFTHFPIEKPSTA